MKDRYLRVLLEERTLQRGYFKPEAVRALIDEHRRGRRNRSGILWRMLVLELWHRNFMEAGLTRGTAAAPMIASIDVSRTSARAMTEPPSIAPGVPAR
jgi:hypothetical protein